MRLFLLVLIAYDLFAISIVDKRIIFNERRIDLTQKYIEEHYDLNVDDINITPRIIVIHWTTMNDLNKSIQCFKKPTLASTRPDIKEASPLNVSAHFLIDRDGCIYRLMDETLMARHVIGLNYCSIGIENVGGKNSKDNLTPEQLKSNIELVAYLKEKYATIEYLIGHHEYTDFSDHYLWLETDESYRTIKHDPGDRFMQKIRQNFTELKSSPEAIR